MARFWICFKGRADTICFGLELGRERKRTKMTPKALVDAFHHFYVIGTPERKNLLVSVLQKNNQQDVYVERERFIIRSCLM